MARADCSQLRFSVPRLRSPGCSRISGFLQEGTTPLPQAASSGRSLFRALTTGVCDILTAGLTLYTTPFMKQLMFWACLFVEGDLFIFCDFYLFFLRISLLFCLSQFLVVVVCFPTGCVLSCLSVSDSLARHKSRVMPPQCLTACFSNAVEPYCLGQIAKSNA